MQYNERYRQVRWDNRYGHMLNNVPVHHTVPVNPVPIRTWEYFTNLAQYAETERDRGVPIAAALLDPLNQRGPEHKIFHGIRIRNLGKIEIGPDISKAAKKLRERIAVLTPTEAEKQLDITRSIPAQFPKKRNMLLTVKETLEEILGQTNNRTSHYTQQAQHGFDVLQTVLTRGAKNGFGLHLRSQYESFAYANRENLPEEVRKSPLHEHAYTSALHIVATAIDAANPIGNRYRDMQHVAREDYMPMIAAAVGLASTVYTRLSDSAAGRELSAHSTITDHLLVDAINMVSLKHNRHMKTSRRHRIVAALNNATEDTPQEALVTHEVQLLHGQRQETGASEFDTPMHYAEETLHYFLAAQATGYYITRPGVTDQHVEYLYKTAKHFLDPQADRTFTFPVSEDYKEYASV